MSVSLTHKTFDPLFALPHATTETLLEFRIKIESLFILMEQNLRKILSSQEFEFQKTFNEQMKAVHNTFLELKAKINNTISKEQNDKKYANLNSEKTFFMKHSLFLHEQNKKLINKITIIKEQLKNTQSEREFYKTEVVSLREKSESQNPNEFNKLLNNEILQINKFRIGNKKNQIDLSRQIFGKPEVKENVVKSNVTNPVLVEKNTHSLSVQKEHNLVFGSRKNLNFKENNYSTKNTGFFITIQSKNGLRSASDCKKFNETDIVQTNNRTWEKSVVHNRLTINNCLTPVPDLKTGKDLNDVILKDITLLNSTIKKDQNKGQNSEVMSTN